MYFLDKFSRSQQIPDYLIDLNLRTDLSWVRLITGAVPERTEEFVAQLTTQNTIPYDQDMLISKFNMSQFFEKDFTPFPFTTWGCSREAGSICHETAEFEHAQNFCGILQ